MKYLHIWAKEVDLSIDEWLAACDVVSGFQCPYKEVVLLLLGLLLHTSLPLNADGQERQKVRRAQE